MKEKKGSFKLNNKGFAITSVIYAMILLFIVLMTMTIAILGRRKILLNRSRDIAKNVLNETDYIYEYKYKDEYKDIYQTFTAPFSGYYRVELWGAQNGNKNGAYATGIINLNQEDKLYVYIGNSTVSDSSIRYDTNVDSSIIMKLASDEKNNYINSSNDNHKFVNSFIIPNDTEMPTYNGNNIMVGNKGNGYAKISYIPTIGLTGYTMTNLINNGSYETTDNNWANSKNPNNSTATISVVTDDSYIGNNSLKFNYPNQTGSVTLLSEQDIMLDSSLYGHKFYGSLMYKTSSNFTSTSNSFDLYYNTQAGGGVVIGEKKNSANVWTKLSNVFTLNSNTFLNNTWKIRNFATIQNPQNYVIYTDALVLVDLTATFGAGNEPDKEWCDKNIGYFEGEIIIYK